MKSVSLGTAVLLSLFTLGAHAADAHPVKMVDGMLVDSKGMTVYTYDDDTATKSDCTGKCAVNWPPVIVTDSKTMPPDYSVITRDDGKKQLAYKGKPLYTFIKDKKPGDKVGDKVKGEWHVVTN